MKKMVNDFIKAVMAGVAICIGAIVFLNVENRIVGAFLFSTGLYTICSQALNLYTGKVGYIVNSDKPLEYISFLIIVWLGNFLGVLGSALAISSTRLNLISKASTLCEIKNADNLLSLFVLGIFCGLLMYAAVDGYKKTTNPFILFLCVMTFILAGFEHSIADMAYYTLANMLDMNALIRLFIITLGNAVGGILLPLLTKK